MKKKNSRAKLNLKKISISNLNEIKGGGWITILCKSQIYDGEDVCVSIMK